MLWVYLLVLTSGEYALGQLPVVPRVTAPGGTWPAVGISQCGGGSCGDIRAVLNVTSADIVRGVATAQIFWRRRDPYPHVKKIIVLTC